MPKRRQEPLDSGDEPLASQPADQSTTLEAEWDALTGAAKEAVSSEIAFQKARLRYAVRESGNLVARAALAGAFLFASLLVLVVGLLLALGQSIGFWWALLIVLGLLLAALAWAVQAPWRAFQSLLALIAEDKDQ
ncbi:hypothetical protein EOE18_04960 [Novosphingobium umbonatum]|uniref:Phage holin family protein n=1 Tax=Novosphingobium umbonatum TaxID=1908524 RepID=A0A3S3TQD7_9SPHN|nr:hypothetical protein [Novosphingobium umbonatum]RVU06194.1 hypothetical protein EOE18_04960 [Novosphingobium umbonatum]